MRQDMASIIILLVATCVAPAQLDIEWTRDAASFNSDLGTHAARVPDVNGDGVDELLVSSPGNEAAELLSGMDGSTIHTFPNTGARAVASAGDVNGDNVTDVVIGDQIALGGMGIARVFSGADASLLHTFSGSATFEFFGRSVLGVGDVNGDGRDDVAVSATGHDMAGDSDVGRVDIYSGLDGSILQTWTGASAGARMGYALARIADLDGDGRDDLVVSSCGCGPGPDIGRVEVLSTATGAQLRSWTGGLGFGDAIAAGGDLDQDGTEDVIVGSPRFPSVGSHRGRVQVFSGATSASLLDRPGVVTPQISNRELGASVAFAGDVDGDGFDDIIAGDPGAAPQPSSGLVFVISGLSGHDIVRIPGEDTGHELGTAVLAPGDLDGDSIPDLIVSALGAGPNGGGRLYAYRGARSPYLGSGEDFTLRTRVAGEEVMLGSAGVTGGDSLELEITSPNGGFFASPVFVVAQAFTTGSPPNVPGFAELHIDEGAFLLFPSVPPAGPLGFVLLPAAGIHLSYIAPQPSIPNVSVMIQAIAQTPIANNFIFAASNGCELVF